MGHLTLSEKHLELSLPPCCKIRLEIYAGSTTNICPGSARKGKSETFCCFEATMMGDYQLAINLILALNGCLNVFDMSVVVFCRTKQNQACFPSLILLFWPRIKVKNGTSDPPRSPPASSSSSLWQWAPGDSATWWFPHCQTSLGCLAVDSWLPHMGLMFIGDSLWFEIIMEIIYELSPVWFWQVFLLYKQESHHIILLRYRDNRSILVNNN